jgi:hypothetical protein
MKSNFHQNNYIWVLSTLTRFTDFIFLVSVSSLLGIISSNGSLTWQFWLVLLANWLSVGFANLLSYIAEAPHDVLEEPKIPPNPIAQGRISPGKAHLVAGGLGVLALGAFIVLGWKVAIFGVIGLLLGWLVSRKGFQFKAIPFLGLFSNTLIVVGITFLTGYFAFKDHVDRDIFFPFLLMLCLNLYFSEPIKKYNHDPGCQNHPHCHVFDPFDRDHLRIDYLYFPGYDTLMGGDLIDLAHPHLFTSDIDQDQANKTITTGADFIACPIIKSSHHLAFHAIFDPLAVGSLCQTERIET